jgi:ectoine hydroxylase
MKSSRITDQQIAQYNADGFLFVEGLLKSGEVQLLIEVAKSDREMTEGGWSAKDAAGRESRINLRADATDDMYSAVARDRRIVEPMTQLIGAPIYHWHHKMMLKEPKVGGAWEWHQDYGYWYNDRCLYPDLASCMIAVDRAHKGNGCLQVLRGSHKIGRVQHGKFGDQTGADPARVEAAKKRLELVHCEMSPGTALFFHGNLLHSSAPNTSDDPRWSLICCYNALHNVPFEGPGHGKPVPIELSPEGYIIEAGRAQLERLRSAAVATTAS